MDMDSYYDVWEWVLKVQTASSRSLSRVYLDRAFILPWNQLTVTHVILERIQFQCANLVYVIYLKFTYSMRF